MCQFTSEVVARHLTYRAGRSRTLNECSSSCTSVISLFNEFQFPLYASSVRVLYKLSFFKWPPMTYDKPSVLLTGAPAVRD